MISDITYYHYCWLICIKFNIYIYICRLGILVDFLSHSTITGFMGGTAVIICLQQFKGLLGMIHFTKKTDVVSVLTSVFEYRHEVIICRKKRKPTFFLSLFSSLTHSIWSILRKKIFFGSTQYQLH